MQGLQRDFHKPQIYQTLPIMERTSIIISKKWLQNYNEIDTNTEHYPSPLLCPYKTLQNPNNILL
jgi:hypothetical protein